MDDGSRVVMVTSQKVEPDKPQRRRHGAQRGLIDRLKRQTGQIAAINAVVSSVSQTLDLSQTLQLAMEKVLEVIPLESSGISLIDEKAGELVMRAQRGLTHDFVTNPMRIKLGMGLSGQAINTGQVVVVRGDLSDNPLLYVPAFAEEKTKAIALAPMRVRGKVIGVLSVMSHDPYDFSEEEIRLLQLIADQVGIAIDNAQLYETTRREQRRLEAVLNSTADAIMALDMQGRITLFNETAEALFDLHMEKVLGHHYDDIALPDIIRNKTSQTMQYANPHTDWRYDITLDDGRYLLMIMSPVYSQKALTDEQMDGWVAVFQDITLIKDAERARLQFIQTAAHDLKNPLGVTLSALTMLHRNWKTPAEDDQEIFNIALTGLNRMQDLIDDLLNLEKVESGVDFRHEPIQIPELVEHCVLDMRAVLSRKEQRLDLNVAPVIPTFYGDDRWLYRALLNLLSNAHKYCPNGSHVVVHARADGGVLELAVEDNGPGIPLEAQSRLFERFYRVRSTEKVSGTGLGLAMVKSVAEKHGGSAECDSEPGRGSIFRMRLPLSQSQRAAELS